MIGAGKDDSVRLAGEARTIDTRSPKTLDHLVVLIDDMAVLIDSNTAHRVDVESREPESVERRGLARNQIGRIFAIVLIASRVAVAVVGVDRLPEHRRIDPHLLSKIFDGVGFEAVALRLKGIPLFLHFCCRLASRQVGTEAEGDTFRLKRSP